MRARFLAAAISSVVSFSCLSPVMAAEGGVGVFLLGSHATGAGITPPPGVFFQNDFYYYDGKLGGGRTLPTGGLLVANVSAQSWIELPTTLWVTPAKILGGDLAFSLTVPVGEPRVNASLLVNSPRFGPIGLNVTDSQANLSDFFLQSFVGWHAGNFHWQLGVGGVIPSGTYVAGQLSNASLNRPALDVFGTFTWLDPAIGWDLSAAMGVTFNQTNTATDYKSGDEFHLEWAATKYITKEFTLGLVGYYYQQLTADSGTGARLGGYEGRVVALGGSIGYTFEIGKLPVSTRLKVYREFDAVNRMEGTAGYFTVSVPVAIDTNAMALSQGRTIKAKF
ncbi:SphA family protein [Tardiphaga robiniae]|uniref:SphA family protein n=1 Tax=Tardiphaga robiniae TaxID=943830 RepID=UPI0015864300|nr:transporter [Tardiphaga robiniae]NUU44511.1 transporter [Tardiphaga robiniae]